MSPPRLRFRPGEVELDAPEPDAALPVGRPGCLLAAAVAAGVALDHVCGGQGRCGTCRVRVPSGAELLDEPGDGERRILGPALDAAPPTRLACRAVPKGEGLVEVEVPAKPAGGDLVIDRVVGGSEP